MLVRLDKATAVALVLLAAVLGLALFRPGFTPPIRGDASVASLERMRLSGDDQTVLIRSADPAKPLLLFLHGGPGMPAMFLGHAFQRPLERDFLVVHWDRRGAGKSFNEDLDPAAVRTSREVADAEALIGRLQQRYGRRKVILVGHSYGSWLGVALARKRPDLIAAYVGVGQVACALEEERRIQDGWLAEQARAAGDGDTLAAARRGGEWDRESALFRYGAESVGMDSPMDMVALALRAPEYNGMDVLRVVQGVQFTHGAFVYDGPPLPLWESAARFDVPVTLFVGARDYVTPPECARRYFEAIQAPAKRLVSFSNSGHFPFLDEPARFRAELLNVAARSNLVSRH